MFLYNIAFLVGSVSMIALQGIITGQQSLKNLESPAVQFISPALRLPMEAMFLYSFLPGRGLSCSYPNPAPGNEQEETPFRSGQQLGACDWEGVGGGARNLYSSNSCKEKRLPRSLALPLLLASVYSRTRKKI